MINKRDIIISCCVVGCESIQLRGDTSSLTFFGLPASPERLEQWIRAIGRDDILHKINSSIPRLFFVCEKHFQDHEIYLKNNRKFLRTSSVPTLNLPPLDDKIHFLHKGIKTSFKVEAKTINLILTTPENIDIPPILTPQNDSNKSAPKNDLSLASVANNLTPVNVSQPTTSPMTSQIAPSLGVAPNILQPNIPLLSFIPPQVGTATPFMSTPQLTFNTLGTLTPVTLNPALNTHIPTNNSVNSAVHTLMSNNNSINTAVNSFILNNNSINTAVNNFIPNNNSMSVAVNTFIAANNSTNPAVSSFIPENNIMNPVVNTFIPTNNSINPALNTYIHNNNVRKPTPTLDLKKLQRRLKNYLQTPQTEKNGPGGKEIETIQLKVEEGEGVNLEVKEEVSAEFIVKEELSAEFIVKEESIEFKDEEFYK